MTTPPPRCPQHASTYQAGCTVCQTRSAWYNRRFRAHRRAGRWEPMVAVEPVRAHIRTLLAAGVHLTDIAARAGLNINHLNAIAYSKTRRRINPATAELILAVTPEPGPARLLDPTGTRRRLRALQAIGWSFPALAERLGATRTLPGKWLEEVRVTRATADRVAALYEELSGTPGPSPIARQRACARGFAPPLAWDDVDMDDPSAEPVLYVEPDPTYVDEVLMRRALAGDPSAARRLTPAEKAALVQAGRRRGVGAEALARILRCHYRVVIALATEGQAA